MITEPMNTAQFSRSVETFDFSGTPGEMFARFSNAQLDYMIEGLSGCAPTPPLYLTIAGRRLAAEHDIDFGRISAALLFAAADAIKAGVVLEKLRRTEKIRIAWGAVLLDPLAIRAAAK